jgi:NADH:ubiquinone oxidoreductase subunit E
MIVQVCIGSACHLKGSYDVIQELKARIAADGLEDQVLLKSSFCLGQCAQAVSVKIDDEPIYSVSPDTVEDFFQHSIKERI